MPETDGKLVHNFYHRILGERPGEGAKEFIKNLTWISLSFAIAKVISALITIAAGRALGPAEYGKINILVATATILSAFLVAGINSAVIRYGVLKEERAAVFSTCGAMFLALAFLVGALVLFSRSLLSSFFNIEVKMLLLALCYAVSYSSFLIVSSMQQASGNFGKRGLSEITFSALLTGAFFLGLAVLGRVYETLAYAYIAAFSCVSLFWLSRLGGHIKLSSVSKKQFLKMFEYSFNYFGVSVGSFLILNVQSLIINTYLSVKEVGIYAAYYTATINAAGYLAYAGTTVLFPKASATTNRKRLWDLAVKGWKYMAPASFFCFLALEVVVLSLMGRHQYGLAPGLMVLFAACGTLMLMQSSLGQIIFADGVKASRLALFMAVGAGLLNFMACLVLIPRFSLLGVPAAFCLTYILMLAWLWKAKDPYLQ